MRCIETLLLVVSVTCLVSCGGCRDASETETGEVCGVEGRSGIDLGWTSSGACHTPWLTLGSRDPSICHVSLCLTGAVDQMSSSNEGFHNMCEYDPIPGLIHDCEGEVCHKTFDTFTDNLERTVYEPMFQALDTNEDGKIDDNDEACELHLIGFSWGGVGALKLSKLLAEDERVSESRRRVSSLLMLDPYRPGADLEIPHLIDRARVWRQSLSPDHDCSRFSPGGPYRGIAPICPEGSDCLDMDISKQSRVFYSSTEGEVFSGRDVGHCDVPFAVRDLVMEALYRLEPEDSNPQIER